MSCKASFVVDKTLLQMYIMKENIQMALSIRQKRVLRISGEPVHGVAVQGAMDDPATCNQPGWRFGTWNVGSLSGRSGEIVDELWRRRVDVCAVQKRRWKGEGTRFVGAKGRRYKLWWKGDDGTGGVGMMVKEELTDKVLEVRRKSATVIVVVMLIARVMVRVISVFAPQQGRTEEDKDHFYNDLSEEIGQAGPDEFVMLLGDLNGHVGVNADGYEGYMEDLGME
jgi:hypothetical protein